MPSPVPAPPGQDRAGVCHPKSESVAEPYLDVYTALFAQVHKFYGKRDAKAVYGRPGDIFKSAPWNYPVVKGNAYYPQVSLGYLFSGRAKF